MGTIIILNRRIVFGVTFCVVFLGGAGLHTLITGNNQITSMLEFLILLAASLGCAYFAARSFPPEGRRL